MAAGAEVRRLVRPQSLEEGDLPWMERVVGAPGDADGCVAQSRGMRDDVVGGEILSGGERYSTVSCVAGVCYSGWNRAIVFPSPRGRALVASARHSHHELLQQTFGSALDHRDIADLTRIKRLAASTPTGQPDASARENQVAS